MRAGPAVAVAVALLVPAVSAGASGPARPAPSVSIDEGRLRVVIVAVPDLRWNDLASMPHLRAFVGSAAVGDLSVRSVGSRTGCADGLLTVNAGDRVGSGVRGCGLTPSDYQQARREAASSSYDAEVGGLGSALRAGGVLTDPLDELAVPLLADRAGDVARSGTSSPPPGPTVQAVVDDDLYVGRPDQRPVTAGILDGEIHDQIAELTAQTTVVVAGISDGPTGGPHLHVVAIRGPHFPPGTLSSGTTRHAPWVQLVDLAPTVLSQLGLPIPSSMTGRPARAHPGEHRVTADFVHDDEHARAALAVKRWIVTGICLAAVAALLAFAAGRRRVALAPAAAAVAAPLLSYLAELTPWWQLGSWQFGVVLAAASLAVGLAFALGPDLPGAVVVLAGCLAALLVGDQLAGNPLQLSAPIGDNPLVAGRFHGLSNIPFALLAGAGLAVAAVVGGRLIAGRGSRRLGLGAALAVVVLLTVVDAAPMLGSDFGGAVTLPVAGIVLLVGLAGRRIHARVVAGALVAGLAVATGVALWDYSRPAAQQTHLGRFVGSVLHHDTHGVVWRKLDLVLHSFGNGAVTALVLVVLAGVVWRAHLAGRLAPAPLPGFGPGVAAVVTLGVLGSVVNDSGIFVAAMAFVAGLLPLLALANRPSGAATGTSPPAGGIIRT